MLTGHRITLIALLLMASNPIWAKSLAERVNAISPDQLFHSPQTEAERSFFNAGQAHFWQEYGKHTSNDTAQSYMGYVLFADPFHYGLKRISFLLGSDCSHFVERLYELLGADFPYAKTRHFIQLGKAKRSHLDPAAYFQALATSDTPIDISQCRWLELAKNFLLLAPGDKPSDGDIFVIDDATGPRGDHGHMGIITQNATILLSAKNHQAGITADPLNLSDPENTYIFRWQGKLRDADLPIDELLQLNQADDPSQCP